MAITTRWQNKFSKKATVVELNVSLEILFNFYEIDNDEAGDNNQKTIAFKYVT